MSQRKIRTADDARACLAAAQASGLPRAAWARAHGIDARSLNAWRLNLARGAGKTATSQTTPLRIRYLSPSSPNSRKRWPSQTSNEICVSASCCMPLTSQRSTRVDEPAQYARAQVIRTLVLRQRDHADRGVLGEEVPCGVAPGSAGVIAIEEDDHLGRISDEFCLPSR
jgi:hypothetical protein